MICQTANCLNNYKLLNSKFCLYADVSNRITSEIHIEALEVHTFNDFSMIQQYFNKDELILNKKKTNFMTFLRKKVNKYLILNYLSMEVGLQMVGNKIILRANYWSTF